MPKLPPIKYRPIDTQLDPVPNPEIGKWQTFQSPLSRMSNMAPLSISGNTDLGNLDQSISNAGIGQYFAGLYQPTSMPPKADSGIQSRIAQARSNLGYGTLLGILGSTLQDSSRQVAPVNDRYLDQTADSIPQYVKDQANNNIDRTASANIQNVMASGAPLNKAANTYAVINAQATNAKSNLAAQQATTDISLRNQKLLRKQQRLDRFGNDTANAANMVADNNNTKIGNAAALGTNYFNQLQRSISNEYALQDQQEERKVYLEQLRQLRRSA